MAMNRPNEIELAAEPETLFTDQETQPESNPDQIKDVNNEDTILSVEEDEEDKKLLDQLIKAKEKIKNSQVEQETKICGNPHGFWLEPVKLKLAAKFMELFIHDKTQESLLKEIKRNIQELRNCFTETINESYADGDADLARLLFLNGCAILQFIHSHLRNELENLQISRPRASQMGVELFCSRHQIPFRLLEVLINLTNDPDQLKNDIVDFLHMNILLAPEDYLGRRKLRTDILQIKDQNAHFLYLLYTLIKLSNEDVGGNNSSNNNKYLPSCCNQQNVNGCLPRFNCFCRRKRTVLQTRMRGYNYKRYFRNVEELKSAGIEFKPGDGLAISFNSRCFNIRGQLRLPPITIDEWTEMKLLNLAAYEMNHVNSKKNAYPITSYIKFMDLLIDKEQDVKELRASRIIWNRLSTDKDIADMFNRIGSKCLEPPQDAYSNVKTEIETHCERKCAIWMAQVYHEHFSSPWTIVALLAAAVILALTAIQTWYAAHP